MNGTQRAVRRLGVGTDYTASEMPGDPIVWVWIPDTDAVSPEGNPALVGAAPDVDAESCVRDRLVYPEGVFRGIMKRERALVLRLGGSFCLLELQLGKQPRRQGDARILARRVADRIRESDMAGWLSDTCLGVLMQATPTQDASHVAEEMAKDLAKSGVTVNTRVHRYPTEKTKSDDTEPTERTPMDDTEPPEVDRILFAGPPRWKRGLDIALSLSAIVLLSPLFLLIALGIELVSPGPFLFKQQRIGFMGRPFTCWKFRTMRPNADAGRHKRHVQALLRDNAPLTKLDDGGRDDRLIPMARFFRATGLDELPQLFNVLCGHMSLVGPRPCIPYEFEQFLPWQRDRCLTPPGLTGLWQVSGKNRTTFLQMLRLDVRYTRWRSPVSDLRIMFSTPSALLAQVAACLSPRAAFRGQSLTRRKNDSGASGAAGMLSV